MARALYNRDTLNLIKLRSHRGDGVHAIAKDIEWGVDELRRVGQRHSIDLIEDSPEQKTKPTKPETTKSPALAAFKTRGRLRSDAILKHPRMVDIVLKISDAARGRLAQNGELYGQPVGTLVAVAVDHAARHGKIEALIVDALAEIEAQT